MATVSPQAVYLHSPVSNLQTCEIHIHNSNDVPVRFKVRADRQAAEHFYVDPTGGTIAPGDTVTCKISTRNTTFPATAYAADRFVVLSSLSTAADNVWESVVPLRTHVHEPPGDVASTLARADVSYMCDGLPWNSLTDLQYSTFSKCLYSPYSIIYEVVYALDPQLISWFRPDEVQTNKGRAPATFECPKCGSHLSILSEGNVCRFECSCCQWTNRSLTAADPASLASTCLERRRRTKADEHFRSVMAHLTDSKRKLDPLQLQSYFDRPSSSSSSSSSPAAAASPLAANGGNTSVSDTTLSEEQLARLLPLVPSSLSLADAVPSQLPLISYCAMRDPRPDPLTRLHRLLTGPVLDADGRVIRYDIDSTAYKTFPRLTVHTDSTRHLFKFVLRNPDTALGMNVKMVTSHAALRCPPIWVPIGANEMIAHGSSAPQVLFDSENLLWAEDIVRNTATLLVRVDSSFRKDDDDVSDDVVDLTVLFCGEESQDETAAQSVSIKVRLSWEDALHAYF